MNEKFNQKEYNKKWDKENMGVVKASFKKDFVTEFKDACKTLDIKQSDAIREMMQTIINKAKEQK